MAREILPSPPHRFDEIWSACDMIRKKTGFPRQKLKQSLPVAIITSLGALPQRNTWLADCSSFLNCNFPDLSRKVTDAVMVGNPQRPIAQRCFFKNPAYFSLYYTPRCSLGTLLIRYRWLLRHCHIKMLRCQRALETVAPSPHHQYFFIVVSNCPHQYCKHIAVEKKSTYPKAAAFKLAPLPFPLCRPRRSLLVEVQPTYSCNPWQKRGRIIFGMCSVLNISFPILGATKGGNKSWKRYLRLGGDGGWLRSWLASGVTAWHWNGLSRFAAAKSLLKKPDGVKVG